MVPRGHYIGKPAILPKNETEYFILRRQDLTER